MIILKYQMASFDRRREELGRSLQNPHTERADLAQQGREAWLRGLPVEDTNALFACKCR